VLLLIFIYVDIVIYYENMIENVIAAGITLEFL